ncbi:MAG: aminotransferase class IV family protein [Clostridia bacterium]|nr:aminotransferase class IV family protein [Clostridia bacterium]
MLVIDDHVSDYLIYNGKMQACTPGTCIGFDFTGPVIYEVIRYIERRGLFKVDHWLRLQKSAVGQGIALPLSEGEFDQGVETLLQRCNQVNCNIKLLVCRGQYVIYFSRTFYPSPEVYETGVSTASIYVERPDPNAKVRRESYIETIADFRKKQDVFEALLLNREGFYTEGSRSNLFFVKRGEDCIYTAPSSMILEGVMRRHLLEVCKSLNVPVIQEAISKEEMPLVEAAFLTGTSIKVLPIAVIDGKQYESSAHPLVRKLMQGFDDYIAGGKA